ncbi:MAG: hypothetical protein HY720_16125 [Planctomycetes bacterium]|nr:hypothetical protein [Planctomycetota bacterium]
MNEPLLHELEAIYSGIEPWEGCVPRGFGASFLGVLTDLSFVMRGPEKDARLENARSDRYERTRLPSRGEPEYYETGTVLRSASLARDRFTMIELGAGYGPHLVSAAVALRRWNPLPALLVGVEPEPTRFQWMCRHFLANGVEPSSNRLVHAAVVPDAVASPWELFPEGVPDWPAHAIASHSDPIENQRLIDLVQIGLGIEGEIDEGPYRRERFRLRPVAAIDLGSILDDLEEVDLVHMDIQGKEDVVLPGAIERATRKVQTFCIGTHSRSIEDGLRNLFLANGWRPLADFAGGVVHSVRRDRLDLVGKDGIQIWENDSFSRGSPGGGR